MMKYATKYDVLTGVLCGWALGRGGFEEGPYLLRVLQRGRGGGGRALGQSDQASGSIMDMAEEFLAREITKSGGCGLARMVAQQLEQRGALNAPTNESPPP